MLKKAKNTIKLYADISTRDVKERYRIKDVENMKDKFSDALDEEKAEQHIIPLVNQAIFYSIHTSKDDCNECIQYLESLWPADKVNSALKICVLLIKIWITEDYNNAKKSAQDIIEQIISRLQYGDLFFRGGFSDYTSAYYTIALRIAILILQSSFPSPTNSLLPIYGDNIRPYAAAWIGEELWKKDVNMLASQYFEVAILTSDTALRIDVYNMWGLCAIDMGEYQLAYDIYFSWLNKKHIGLIKNLPSELSQADDALRKEHPILTARIYSNMAYICGTIADLSGDESHIKKTFRQEALSYIKKAIELDGNSLASLHSYATLLYDIEDYDGALNAYEICLRQTTITEEERLSALGSRIEVALEQFSRVENLESLPDSWGESDSTQEIISGMAKYQLFYNLARKKAIGRKNTDLKEELDRAEAYCEISKLDKKALFGEKADENSKNSCFYNELIVLLLCIYNMAQLIRGHLRCYSFIKQKFVGQKAFLRKDNGSDDSSESVKKVSLTPIAYYTTLNNLQYLLGKVYQESDEPFPVPVSDDVPNGKNCLTMMHAHYMNDPNEGISLLQALSSHIDEVEDDRNWLFSTLPPTVFREKLFDQNFVFLKSFTSLVDQLNMWTMYASDRSENSDSNGCCVCIAPETFDMMVKAPKADDSGVLIKGDKDDYQLYKVAYINNGKLVGGDKKLEAYYSSLKCLFVKLNRTIKKYGRKLDATPIISRIQKALTPILFLFKDAAYQAENELRLIITRDRADISQIRKTNETPNKLFVMPYHQIYVDKIILGPKVKAPDKWIPYLQYELVKMWDSWPEKRFGERTPSVRKSSISYRD